jgi:hypothetical protein
LDSAIIYVLQVEGGGVESIARDAGRCDDLAWQRTMLEARPTPNHHSFFVLSLLCHELFAMECIESFDMAFWADRLSIE